MRDFNITRKSKIEKTFRVAKVMADFDYNLEEITETFKGAIALPEKWNIGLIVGGSGTGKSTIAKEIFKDNLITNFEYKCNSVIDDMPRKCDIETIEKTFYNVGFGSVPSWLKPYSVLSNGEKMRVDLARAMLEKEFIVFDEFTSVVDRDIAKTACIALNKAIKKSNKKFIAISCHYDIIEQLQPDWIFDTNTMQNFFQFRQDHSNYIQLENVILAKEKNCGKNLSVITI